jgi:hypothetical protein
VGPLDLLRLWAPPAGVLISLWVIGAAFSVPPTTLIGLTLVWVIFWAIGYHGSANRPWCEWTGSPLLAKALGTCLFLALSASMVVRHHEVERDTIDLLLLGALGSIMLLQAVVGPTTESYRILLLTEALAVGMFSIWSVSLSYPLYNGRIDFLFHSAFTSEIVRTGRLPGTSIYSTFPGLHVLTSSIHELTGLPVPVALTVGMSVAMAATLPAILRLVRTSTNSLRVALIAVVLFSSSAEFQLWGRNATPTTLGFALAIIAFTYSVVPPVTTRKRAVVLLLVVAVTVTHVLAAALLVVMFFIAWLALRWNSASPVQTTSRPYLSPFFVVLALVVVLGYWSFVAARVFETYVPILSQAIRDTELSAPSFQTGVPNSIINSLHLLTTFLVFFVAFSTVFWRYRSSRPPLITVALGLASLYVVSLLPIAVSSIFLGGLGLAVGRWALFGLPFVAQLTAIQVMAVRNNRLRATVIIGLLLAVNLAVPAASFDSNHVWIGTQVGRSTDYFTSSELAASEFVQDYARGQVATDFVYAALFRYYLADNSSRVSYSYDSFLQDTGVHVIRVDELTQRGLQFVSAQEPFFFVTTVTDVDRVIARISVGSRIYDSGTVVIIRN